MLASPEENSSQGRRGAGRTVVHVGSLGPNQALRRLNHSVDPQQASDTGTRTDAWVPSR